MKFTIQHVVYVIKQSVSPKMFTNERLFTIQAFTITRVHCTSNMIYIVALGVGLKCPHKMHLNTQSPPRLVHIVVEYPL